MATKIRGITIELGADASGIEKALKGVNTEIKKTQSNLKDIEKLLKFDPGNTELLAQKQKNLEKAVSQTADKLQQLQAAQANVAQGSAGWDALQREIIATENDLKNAEKALKDFGSVAAQKCKAAGESMKEFGGKVQDVGKKLSVISGAAAGALGALGKLGYDTMQSADELNTLSKQTGISTDELQKWKYAADLVDVSVEDMTGALKKLKKNMSGDATAIKKLGVNVKNADGSFRDVNDVFYDTLKALSGIDDETERDLAAMEIFGKSADDLAGIIDDGGAALQAYGQEAENLGLIMSGETLDSLNEANDTVDKLKQNVSMSLAQAGATLATTFAPVLEKISTLIGQVTEKIRNLTPEQAETITKVLAVIAVVGPLVLVIGQIISGIGTLMTVLPLLLSPFGLIVAAIAAVIAIGVILYKHWDEIKEYAAQLKDKLVETWNNIKDSITRTVENIKTKVTTVWTTITDTVKNKIDNLKDAVKSKFETIKDTVHNVIEKIKGFFSFQWTLPHIPLPHFSIYPPGWKIGDLLQGSIPSLGIEWYKKAYNNPVMFTSPTVMATQSGLKGFGDGTGAEIVMGLDKLRELVGAQTSGVTINVYGAQGQDVNALADAIGKRFIALNKSRKAAGMI